MNLSGGWSVFSTQNMQTCNSGFVNQASDQLVDEFLIARCQSGDRVALQALITKWQPAFLRYATVMTRDPDLAADVLQDAWIKIIRSMPTLRDPLRFPAWAYRIINNRCLDLLRQQKPQDKNPKDAAEQPAEKSSIHELEEREQVWWILAQLTPEHRSVLALHYLQGFEVKEIAGIVRKPQGTVKSRLHNARERFRQLFSEQLSFNGDNHEQTGPSDSGSLESCFRPA